MLLLPVDNRTSTCIFEYKRVRGKSYCLAFAWESDAGALQWRFEKENRVSPCVLFQDVAVCYSFSGEREKTEIFVSINPNQICHIKDTEFCWAVVARTHARCSLVAFFQQLTLEKTDRPLNREKTKFILTAHANQTFLSRLY
jgi:hypothetical protein